MVAEILERRVEARPVAVVRCRTSLTDLSATISEALGPVWAFVQARPELKADRNVVIYNDEHVNIECGVEIARSFAYVPDAIVVCGRTPACRVVMSKHVGPYQDLPVTHAAIHAHAAARGLKLGRPCWEVYEPWSADPRQLCTEVYYRLDD